MGYSEDFIPDGMNAFERNVKRIGDCIVAAVLMIVFSPLFLICYIAVKREDGGAAILSKSVSGVSDGRFISISFAVCDWMQSLWALNFMRGEEMFD